MATATFTVKNIQTDTKPVIQTRPKIHNAMWTMNGDELTAASPPPPGIVSNFDNPAESLVPQVLVVAIVLNLLAIIFCGIRLYTVKVVIHRHQRDDDLIFIGLLFATAYSVIQVYETRNGAGHHIWDVSRADAVAFHKLSMVDLAAYSLSVLFTKASILVFYLRFPLKRAVRIVVYVVMFATVAYSLAGALGWAYLCTPMEKIWDMDVSGTCVDRSMWWLMLSVCNVATDLAILLLPIWILSPLSLRLVKKIEMTIFLMAGGFLPPVPKSARRKSFGRQAVDDVPDAEMRTVRSNWPLKNEEPFDHVEYQDFRLSQDHKTLYPAKPVDVAEMFEGCGGMVLGQGRLCVVGTVAQVWDDPVGSPASYPLQLSLRRTGHVYRPAPRYMALVSEPWYQSPVLRISTDVMSVDELGGSADDAEKLGLGKMRGPVNVASDHVAASAMNVSARIGS
ncbi:integral membrane protein [Colletotrichum salicis]|uniref:Integral membrane protein n=1 Tax=Colletotrichum salicis TaxID=1209931 RepID=A0A135RT96_9PEZI|nr:integral membrane protein [Colletotrichum salicis]